MALFAALAPWDDDSDELKEVRANITSFSDAAVRLSVGAGMRPETG